VQVFDAILMGDRGTVALQIVGPMHADALVLRAAGVYESTCEWKLPVVPKNRR
jgi:Asp-tRNA(Asn)/Glu-tRNA(Gln) amidotransferase A subunit family amidase